MDGARTRGQATALAAVRAMIRGGAPHAILLSGPDGVGKTTMAVDLAAGLLCAADDPATRPCGTCRGCRMVVHGQHPDLHRLRPDGPGRQIVIGSKDDGPRGVRDLQRDLVLLPMEGGARVAIIESAQRMNDDAQAALLKTLEEPPPGVTIILCADEEAQLLETVRSRCARVRLGTLAVRDIETILVERGVADAPAAARLARVASGRPGVALAYALAPDAIQIRGELSRTIVDLLGASPALRIEAVRTMSGAALKLAAVLADGALAADGRTAVVAPVVRAARGTRGSKAVRIVPASEAAPAATSDEPDGAEADADSPTRSVPAVQRRRAAEALLTIWIAVARDLALVAAGGARSIADPDLLEELTDAAETIPSGAAALALRHVERAAMLLASNVSPELVLDDLALAWPRRRRAA